MPEPRATHPFYLYDAIHAQPALIEKVLARRDAIERAADAMAEKERITFVGIGTSLHAAQIAELWMREFTAGRIWALAFAVVTETRAGNSRTWCRTTSRVIFLTVRPKACAGETAQVAVI